MRQRTFIKIRYQDRATNWLYGHNWVCLAMALVMGHPLFGVIALPLLSLLYVRKVDIDKLNLCMTGHFARNTSSLWIIVPRSNGRFGTGSKAGFVVVFDGAHATKKLVQPLINIGAIVVTRLRSDAKLFDLPMNPAWTAWSSAQVRQEPYLPEETNR